MGGFVASDEMTGLESAYLCVAGENPEVVRSQLPSLEGHLQVTLRQLSLRTPAGRTVSVSLK